MKKFFIFLNSVLFAILACCGITGCKSKTSPQAEATWIEVNINNENISNYFYLDGYLGYSFNNGSGSLVDPWGDNYFYSGSGKAYIEYSNYIFNRGDEKGFTLSDLTESKDDSLSENCLRWKVIILKAKQDIVIDFFKLRAIFGENADTYNYNHTYEERIKSSDLSIKFSIKKYASNSIQENPILDTIASYDFNHYANRLVLTNFSDNRSHFDYSNIALFRDYYGEELYEWNRREVLVKKGQLLCVEFNEIQQIESQYETLANQGIGLQYRDIEKQANMDFIVDCISLVCKVQDKIENLNNN